MEQSPLARLAPEVCNEIYELAITVPRSLAIEWRAVIVHAPKNAAAIRPAQKRGQDYAHPTALLQTCRQIRKDATQMFYAVNTFKLDCSRFQWTSKQTHLLLSDFLDSIGKDNAICMQSLTVDAGMIRTDSVHTDDARMRHAASLMAAIEQIDMSTSLRKAGGSLSFVSHLPDTNFFRSFDLDSKHLLQSLEKALQSLAVEGEECEKSAATHENAMRTNFVRSVEHCLLQLQLHLLQLQNHHLQSILEAHAGAELRLKEKGADSREDDSDYLLLSLRRAITSYTA